MLENLRRLATDSLIYGLGDTVGRLLNIILIPVLARLLTPEEFGLIDLVISAAVVVSYLLALGLNEAASRYYFDADEPSERARLLGSWLLFQSGLSLSVCLLLFPLAPILADLLLRDPTLTPYIQLALLYMLATLLASVFRTVLRLRFAPWRYSLLSLTQFALNVTLILFLVLVPRMGVMGVLVGYLGANALTAALGLGLTWRYFALSFSTAGLRQMLAFGLPFVPANVMGWVMNWSNRYFLLYLATTQQVGLYAVGSRLGSLVWLPIFAFQLAWAPFAYSIEKEPQARQTYARVLTYYVLGTSALATMVSIFARPALLILASPAFYPGHTVAGLVAFAMVANGASYVTGMGMWLVKKTGSIMWITAASSLLVVSLNLLLVPLMGMEGAAAAYLMGEGLRTALYYIISQRLYLIPYDLGRLFKTLLLASVAAALGVMAETGRFWPNLALEVAIAVGYLGLIYPLGIVERREVALAWAVARARCRRLLVAVRGQRAEESGSG